MPPSSTAFLGLVALVASAAALQRPHAPAAFPAAARAQATTAAGAESPTAPAPTPTADGAAPPAKSALVFGFFAAKDRELNFIKKQYAKYGYDDVVVEPSAIARLARPSGWYKVFRENAGLGRDHHLARHFDVVHCMSGGFLHLYLTRGAGVPLTCDTLLLDSTPILPKPAAFVTFARQFIRDLGAGRLVDLFPRVLHLSIVRARWSLTALRLRLQHRLLRWSSGEKIGHLTAWLRMSSAAAISGGALTSFDEISKHAERTIFASSPRAEPPKRTVFLHNPDDPYLSHDDVLATLDAARALGMPTHVREVPTNHVQTIFRDPKTVMAALAEAEAL